MNKLFAIFPALVFSAALASTAKAQNTIQRGYFYNKHSNHIMVVEDNVVKAYDFDANKLPAALFEFDVNEQGGAALKNVLSQRFIGKVGKINEAVGTQTDEFRYKMTQRLDENGFVYYSFADTTSLTEKDDNFAEQKVSLHNNGNNNVVPWKPGINPVDNNNTSTPSRWYFVSSETMENFASFQANKDMLKGLAKEVAEAKTPAYVKEGNGLITEVGQLGSNAVENTEGSLAALIGQQATSNHPNNDYFHSSYSGGSPNSNGAKGPHNLWVTFDNTDDTKNFIVEYERRSQNKNNRPLEYKVYGGHKENGEIKWDAEPFSTITESGAGLDVDDYNGLGATKGHFTVNAPKAYTALRFDVVKTSSNTRFFTMKKFQLFKASVGSAQARVVKKQLITSASQITSDNKEPSEGSYANLLDGNPSTIFHSTWSNGNKDKKEHNLILTFDNSEQSKNFKLAYNARKNGGSYPNIPVKVEIYGRSGNAAWEKINDFDSSHPNGFSRSFNESQFGGYSGIVDINTGSKVYNALKLKVVKTDDNNKFFALGDLALYTEKNYPAATTPATAEQAEALNLALGLINGDIRPYDRQAEIAETTLKKALNAIVPDVVQLTKAKKQLEAQYQEALAKTKEVMNKAVEAIKKSPFTTEDIQDALNEEYPLLGRNQALAKQIDNLYHTSIVSGATDDNLQDYKGFLDNFSTQIQLLKAKTTELETYVAAFVDPASRVKVVPLEPWLNAPYAVHWDKEQNLKVKRTDRKSRGFRVIVGDEAPQEFLSAEEPTYIYNERTDTVEVQPGQDIRVEPQYNNTWMHGYVYLDANQDKKFDWENLTPGQTNSEVVAYNYYQGKNSLGEDAKNEAKAENQFFVMPAFKAPEKPGVYRVRTKIDWNNIDPAGQYNGLYTSNFINDNGGYIFDFNLKVVSPSAISGVAFDEHTLPAYDLMGRRVKSTSQPQIIIVGGKKQLNK